MAARKKKAPQRGGKPVSPKTVACPYCGQEFAEKGLRRHLEYCPENPFLNHPEQDNTDSTPAAPPSPPVSASPSGRRPNPLKEEIERRKASGEQKPTRTGTTGDISDAIQTIANRGETGRLNVRVPDKAVGTIHFKEGAVTEASLNISHEGEEAVYAILALPPEGTWEFYLGVEAQFPNIDPPAAVNNLLLEGCRRLDEGKTAATQPVSKREKTKKTTGAMKAAKKKTREMKAAEPAPDPNAHVLVPGHQEYVNLTILVDPPPPPLLPEGGNACAGEGEGSIVGDVTVSVVDANNQMYAMKWSGHHPNPIRVPKGWFVVLTPEGVGGWEPEAYIFPDGTEWSCSEYPQLQTPVLNADTIITVRFRRKESGGPTTTHWILLCLGVLALGAVVAAIASLLG